MEIEQSLNIISRYFQKYRYYCLLMLRSKLRIHPKLINFLHIFHLVQLLTLIFKFDEHSSLPWNYSVLSTLWTSIAIATRIDYLGLYFNFIHIWAVFSSIIWIYLISKVLIIYKVECNEFTASIPKDGFTNSLIAKHVMKLHTYSSDFLFTFQPVSTLQAFLGMPAALNGTWNGELIIVISILNLILYLLIYMEDTAFLQKISWVSYKKYEVILSTRYVFMHRILNVALNLSIVYIDYDKDGVVYSAALVIIGVSQGYLFAFKQPYAWMQRNCLIGVEGVIIGWAGVVLYLTEFYGYIDQDSYFSTLLYFIPLGFLLYIYKELIFYIHKKLIQNKEFKSMVQVFHIFQLHIIKSDSISLHYEFNELRQLIQSAMRNDPANLTYLLWLVYIMTLQEKYIPVKVLISQLENKNNFWLKIYLEQAREDYYITIQSIISEREAFEYILYISYYHKLLQTDRRSTNLLINLYEDLLSRQQKSKTLSRDMTIFHKSILDTRDLYHYMISVFDRSTNMYEMYASYLDAIENSPDAKEEIQKANKYKQEILRKNEAKEMEIFYFDSRNLVLLLSTELKSLGNIMNVQHLSEFGYKEIDLESENVSVIFPPIILESYLLQLRLIHDIWKTDSCLHRSEQCYVYKDDYLAPAIVRNNVINLKNGELAVILAVKLKTKRQEIAILDEEGRFILSYTQTLARFMSEHLNCPENSLKSLNLLNMMHKQTWKPYVTLIDGYGIIEGQHIRVATAYRTFFGNKVKVLIARNDFKTKLDMNLGLLNLNTHIIPHMLKFSISENTQSFDLFKIPNKTKSKRNTYQNEKQNFAKKPKEVNDLTTKNISTQQLIIHSDEGISLNHLENIQKSLDSVKHVLVSKIRKRTYYLKIGLFIITSIVCIILTVILVESRNITIESFDTLNHIRFIGSLRSSTTNLTLLTTELFLIDRGYYFNRPREDIQSMISSLGENYNSILRELNDIGDSDDLSDYLRTPNQTFWQYQEEKFVNREISLLNTLKEISIRCDSLSQVAYLNTTNTDFLEIYRNGADNWYHMMEDSISLFITLSNLNAENHFDIVTWLSISLGLVTVILLISLVGVPIYMILKIRKSIWTTIFSVHRNLLISGEIRARERLIFLHNEELEVYNRKPNLPKKSEYRIHVSFSVLIMVIIVFLIGVTGFLYYYNDIYLVNKIKLIYDTSYYYDLTVLHKALFFRSTFLLRQIQFQPLVMKEFPLTQDPYQLLDDNLDIIKKVHTDIMGVTEISTDIYDNFFNSIGDSYFRYGMHPLTIELIQSFRDSAKLLRNNSDYFETGNLMLEDTTFEYCNKMFDVLVGNIEKGTNAIKESKYIYTILTTVVYMIGLIAYTTVIEFSVVSYIRNMILTELYILTLLPIDDVGYFMSMLRSI